MLCCKDEKATAGKLLFVRVVYTIIYSTAVYTIALTNFNN